jgi:D-beta-D-heptose 7-phosphate kinase / D-beta-D-heptose 1-phosphate adenosyltransferase
VKGADDTRDEVVGRDVVEKAGGDVILIDLVPGHSTTAMVERAQPVKQAVED